MHFIRFLSMLSCFVYHTVECAFCEQPFTVTKGCTEKNYCDSGYKFLVRSEDVAAAMKEVTSSLNSEYQRRCWACANHQNLSATPRDCQDWYASGFHDSGDYTIYPTPGITFQVRCDMTTDGGGWTVIQRRASASDFYKSWAEYTAGFGDEHNFWLGNEKVFALTGSGGYKLRVDLTAIGGATAYASYQQFAVAGEKDVYRLSVSNYIGTAGDSLSYSNNMAFSAKDRDNDLDVGSCALYLQSAWWYNACRHADLNGPYGGDRYIRGLIWYHWHGNSESLASSEMKIRRK
ncbi:ficolin-2-like [Dreissena polymorpha]|uniref:Fibrinogen C-terminal domain-containing protein n=1 Tax=Dreissena polymorpha TaxID=45954 RepID=A0A9D4RRV1_DREPO|nr:ficolin-2-like [Dreissena polymorpha]XP_052265490.1 ficolin-2-like [Dreissena polymorpha]KAH3869316.1 hypothetical protein DPMN_032479 [Dreissena polymorpha]KAH3876673.1 hypothetical protein DPMN_000521 [Dreissena polymorpha]